MIVVVMGVTGSGKTTIGEPLAHDFGWEFADADDFHSPPMSKRCGVASHSITPTARLGSRLFVRK